MSKHYEYIGTKIKELSGDISQRADSPFGQDKFFNPIFEELDFLRQSAENLFIHIGEFLISQTEEHKMNLVKFVEVFGLQLIKSKASLDQSIHYVYLTRYSIIDLLELEVLHERISIKNYFDVIKIIEYLFQLMSKTLLNIYSVEMSDIKIALDESKEDLKMTLREYTDLERALNEATIFAISDHEDKILYANDKFCNLYQYTIEELIGKTHDIYSSHFHPPAFFDEIWETIESGNVWKGEILNQAKDGTKYWLDTTIIPFVDSNGERYKHISIQYDITEKRNSEETLRNTEKLSMIGELAAGIAHEIRNPLTTIRGFVQLMNQNGKEPYYYTDTILDEIDRINYIVSELMIFAKPHQVQYNECNIKSILTSVIKFLEPEANLKNVEIEYELPIEEVIISGERNQLKQVFLNLLKNSIEAMPSGGKIYILLERTTQNIIITIKDEGIGMETEQIKKLGEPFFTTKQEGNGLGLMVSYKIIQNHKGSIHVNSNLNQGTTFTISFESPQKNKIVHES
ncbi:PAS domain-containing protein [Bacillus sp. FJAT-29953]|nr:PAS domain-containing protein [Bacillus sp. FJAT-29953]